MVIFDIVCFMTGICEKFNEKFYSTGNVKKKKIGYFPTLGGGISDKVGKFQLFFFNPSLSNIFFSESKAFFDTP